VKILFFTPMSLDPIHPRVELNKRILENNGYDVHIFNLDSKGHRLFRLFDYLSLGFLSFGSTVLSFFYVSRFSDAEVVYLTDLKYLPIAIVAKIFKKKVVYETLDNNVELYFYNLSRKYKIFRRLKFLKRVFFFLEKVIAKYFVDKIIVNSKALKDYFKPLESEIIFYSSPFEGKFNVNFNNKELVGLYLGVFSRDKGAEEIMDLIYHYNIKLFLFGDIPEKHIMLKLKFLKNKGLVFYKRRMSPSDLEKELLSVFRKYRPVGFSLIKSVHYSYATQEANKDIDYLAMGIPIIGNYRLPTKEKINSGCGVFYNDEEKILKLFHDREFYRKLSLNAVNFYKRMYARDIYQSKLLGVFEYLVSGKQNEGKNSAG